MIILINFFVYFKINVNALHYIYKNQIKYLAAKIQSLETRECTLFVSYKPNQTHNLIPRAVTR